MSAKPKTVDEILLKLIFEDFYYYTGDFTKHPKYLESKAALKALVLAVIPKAKEIKMYDGYAKYPEDLGFNDCRQETIRAIEELFT